MLGLVLAFATLTSVLQESEGSRSYTLPARQAAAQPVASSNVVRFESYEQSAPATTADAVQRGAVASAPIYTPSGPTPSAWVAPKALEPYPSDAPPAPFPIAPAAAPQDVGTYRAYASPAPASGTFNAVAGKAVQLTKVVMSPPGGAVYAALQQGMFCVGGRNLIWTGGAVEQKAAPYVSFFRDAMLRAGVSIQGDPANLFEQASDEGATAEFSIGALVKDIRVRACAPQPVGPNATSAKGEATVTVEWQVFSRLTREVVAKITTQGAYEQPNAVPGGFMLIYLGAFKSAAERLGGSAELHRLLSGPAMPADQLLRPTSGQPPIVLQAALGERRRTLDDETQSVVLIYAGEGIGSGFLVSDDGYILTDSHVVGNARQVRLRWADGREEVADVVRTDRARDVALIKADPQGHRPLPLRQDAPGAGETVFAIGAPLGKSFQGTVTRGVISAKRVLEGFAYLQSDITVNPGSSGGPLLDEEGHVIGLTRAGVRLFSAPTGINLFIPLNDAMAFLTLQRGKSPN